MTASLVERRAAQSATPALAFTSTPQAGDVLIVVAGFKGAAGRIGSITGMGATWSRQATYYTGDGTGYALSDASVDVWAGTGPAMSGTVTVNRDAATASASITPAATGYLVRGTSGTVSSLATIVPQNAVASSVDGPARNLVDGQFVIDFATVYASGTITFPSASTPAAGWASASVGTSSIYAKCFDSTRAVDAAGTYQQTGTTTSPNDYWIVAQVVAGGAAVATVTGAAAMNAASTLTAGPDPAIATAAAPLTATSSTSATATLQQFAAAALAATVTLTGTGVVDRPASATLSASSILTSDGTTGTPTVGAAAALTSSSSLTATGAPTTRTATAALTGSSVFYGAARLTINAAATLDATSVLTAQPDDPDAVQAGVSMDATSDLQAVPDTVVEAWTADRSGRDTLDQVNAAPVTLVVSPPLAQRPPNLTGSPLRRVAFPGMPHDATNAHPYAVEGDYGTAHLFVGGVDVTYLQGAPVVIDSWSDELPGGEQTAVFNAPQVQPDDPAPFGRDANVDVQIVRPDGTRDHQWAGRLVLDQGGHDQASTTATYQAAGALIADADRQQHRAPIIQDPEDIGRVIPRELAGIVSRRFGGVANTTTGVITSDRGSWSDTVWGYVQSLLALAWTPEGRQWTIGPAGHPRTYRAMLKQDPNAPRWTFTLNQPGLVVDLAEDQTQRANAIYGHGIEPDGGAWANWVFPDISTDNAPDYPFGDASRTINVGTTDANTDSGNGVSTWQQGARGLGFDIAVDGVYNAADVAIVRRVQARCGIQVDGSIGPQTWVATFQTGSNAGDLNNATRLPLAVDPAVEPNTYAANGAVIGANPAYDPRVARYELDVDFGTGITKAAGITSARQMLARMKDPGWTGTITASTDPWEGHKLDVRPGHRIRLHGFRGGDLDVWVVSRTVSNEGGQVQWKVDTKARDAMTLAAIQSRNIAAGLTPSGAPLPHRRASSQSVDVMTQFDKESRAGVIPRLPLFHGLWTVVNVPVTLTGTISLVDLVTTAPATEFVVAIFGAPITPNQLAHMVGNPFTETGAKRWTDRHDQLVDQFAWCEKYGDASQPCGYSPGQKSDGAKRTGRLLDTNALTFTSRRGGRAWVAFFARDDCYIEGRIRSGAVPV